MHFSVVGVLAGLTSLANAIDIDLDNTDSILNASKIIVGHILDIFPSEGTPPRTSSPNAPGDLPQPYYWWNSGLAHSSLLNYWSVSGDDSIAEFIRTGMLFQVGTQNNYMPQNQSASLGNDDQASWALAAMTAAEVGFPIRDNSTSLSWLQLAQNVFDSQVARWDEASCDGGLKWQISIFNNDYNYKNSFSNGLFAELAARLHRYTGNETYADWAQRSVEWSRTVGLISSDFAIYDGTDDTLNCTEINHIQWSSNAGVYLKAAAYMSNVTSRETATGTYWNELAEAVLTRSTPLFTANDTNLLVEVACEPNGICSTDQQSFKSIYINSLGHMRNLMPGSDQSNITAILRTSADAAANSCTEEFCQFSWTGEEQEDELRLGPELNALEVFLANLPARQLLTGTNATMSDGSTNSNETTGDDQTDTDSGVPESTGSAASFAASPVLAVGGILAMLVL